MRTRHLAALTVLAASVACLEGTGIPEGMSRARILLTDAPFPYDQVQRVDVHVVSVAAATSADRCAAWWSDDRCAVRSCVVDSNAARCFADWDAPPPPRASPSPCSRRA